MSDFESGADVLDVRDAIARFEELEGERDSLKGRKLKAWLASDDGAEFATLESLLEDLKGNGGDEQWRGDWYPTGLIRDSYFEDYAQELAEDIGAIDKDASWPNMFIDWKRACDALQMDYTTTEIEGVTYWYR